MLFFIAGLLPIFIKPETENDDIDKESEDYTFEYPVTMPEGYRS